MTDWGFPSNHATIAGAVALAVLWAWPRMGLFAAPLTVLAASSRVFVGVHYPHDVIIGFVLGLLVASIVIGSLVRPVTSLVGRLRQGHRLEALL